MYSSLLHCTTLYESLLICLRICLIDLLEMCRQTLSVLLAVASVVVVEALNVGPCRPVKTDDLNLKTVSFYYSTLVLNELEQTLK